MTHGQSTVWQQRSSAVINRFISLVCLLLAVALLVSCAAATATPRPTPKPTPNPRLKPTLTPIDHYLDATSDTYESINDATRTMRTSAEAHDKDPSLFNNRAWRQKISSALVQMRSDYQTLLQVQPPSGTEDYHQAMLEAEAHDDRAAELLLAWLDDRDEMKYRQAIEELRLTQAALLHAQEIFDKLLKK